MIKLLIRSMLASAGLPAASGAGVDKVIRPPVMLIRAPDWGHECGSVLKLRKVITARIIFIRPWRAFQDIYVHFLKRLVRGHSA